MAVTTVNTLRMKFKDSNDESVIFSYSPAKANPTPANVRSLMQGIITNNAIFQETPATMVSAEIVAKTTTDIDIS